MENAGKLFEGERLSIKHFPRSAAGSMNVYRINWCMIDFGFGALLCSNPGFEASFLWVFYRSTWTWPKPALGIVTNCLAFAEAGQKPFKNEVWWWTRGAKGYGSINPTHYVPPPPPVTGAEKSVTRHSNLDQQEGRRSRREVFRGSLEQEMKVTLLDGVTVEIIGFWVDTFCGILRWWNWVGNAFFSYNFRQNLFWKRNLEQQNSYKKSKSLRCYKGEISLKSEDLPKSSKKKPPQLAKSHPRRRLA